MISFDGMQQIDDIYDPNFESLENGGITAYNEPTPSLRERIGAPIAHVAVAASSAAARGLFDEFLDEAPQPQRVRHRAPQQQPPPPPPPPVHEPPPRLARVVTSASERVDEIASTVRRRCGPRCEQLYRVRTRIRNALCGLVVVSVLLGVLASALSDQSAFIDDVQRPQYARAHVDGVRFDVPAAALACDEIGSGVVARPSRFDEPSSLDDVAAAQRYLLDDDRLTCICAPMVGLARRHALVRAGQSVLELFNPTIDDAWDGRVDDETTLDVAARSIVTEKQDHLFPGRVEAVRVVRYDVVRVTYLDNECAANSIVLRREHAWCMQSCVDLMAGRSIYDTGIRPPPSHTQ